MRKEEEEDEEEEQEDPARKKRAPPHHSPPISAPFSQSANLSPSILQQNRFSSLRSLNIRHTSIPLHTVRTLTTERRYSETIQSRPTRYQPDSSLAPAVFMFILLVFVGPKVREMEKRGKRGQGRNLLLDSHFPRSFRGSVPVRRIGCSFF